MSYKTCEFDSIYIMDSDNSIIKPCLLCRQNFVEFFDKNVNIIILTIDGREVRFKMDDICPHPFSMED